MPQKSRQFDRIAFVASDVPEALDALARLTARYGNADPAEADDGDELDFSMI